MQMNINSYLGHEFKRHDRKRAKIPGANTDETNKRAVQGDGHTERMLGTVWTVLDLTVEALSRRQTPQGGLELRVQVPRVTFPLERLVRRIAHMQWRQSGQRG